LLLQWNYIDTLAHERRRLADLLETIPGDQWLTASNLPGWTVKEVVAHIVLEGRYDLVTSILGTIWHLGMNRYMAAAAKRYARNKSPQTLIQELRRQAGSARTPPGISLNEVRIDLLAHRQDILISIGHTPDLTDEQADIMLAHLAKPSLVGRWVLRQVWRRLDQTGIILPDGTMIGRGTDIHHLTPPQAVLFLLGRIDPSN